jgi:hypothetical protein
MSGTIPLLPYVTTWREQGFHLTRRVQSRVEVIRFVFDPEESFCCLRKKYSPMCYRNRFMTELAGALVPVTHL